MLPGQTPISSAASPTGELRTTPATPAAPTVTTRYRHDLDGVRGLAVALVVVFHIYFGRVSGGVDVFLVMSGFFFVGSLLRTAQRGKPMAPLSTAWRTVRRLVPSLTVVLVSVAVATVLLKPNTQWSAVGDQLIASLLHVQNWHSIAVAGSYSAADQSISPLQHLWSVSVQGQFFLMAIGVVALVTWLCRRLGRQAAVAPVITGVCVVVGSASFLYAVALRAADRQEDAYYDSFARAWELLVGALLAIVVVKLVLPRAVRWAAGIAGLVALFTCGMFFDGAALFPGPAALYPVGAAALLIVAGCSDPAAGPTRWLSSAPLRTLGAWSYPLYLWHWPILIFYLGAVDEPVDLWAVVLVSVLLAWLTHRFVEKPLRVGAGPWSVPRVGLAAGVVVLAAATAVSSLGWNQYVARHSGQLDTSFLADGLYPGARAFTDGADVPDAPYRPTALEAPRDYPFTSYDGCITEGEDVLTCVYGDPTATRTIALVGGSHSEQWVTALAPVGAREGVRIVTYLKVGCPLSIATVDDPFDGDYASCLQWSENVLNALADDRPDYVFTTSTRPSPGAGPDVVPRYYEAAWSRLAADGIDVVALRDNPWIIKDDNPVRAVDCLEDGGDARSCGMPRLDALAPVDPAVDASARHPNLRLMDLSEAFCDSTSCPAVIGNVLVYYDSHHLSASWVRTLEPAFARQLGAATQWW